MSYTILLYSIISFFLFFFFANVSYKFNLVDIPSKRKIHSEATAYTGGIAVSFSLVLSILFFDISDVKLNHILSIAFLSSGIFVFK